MITDSPTIVRVTHRFAASADRVFDAWLDPKAAARWLFATPTGTMVRAEIDARVGGRYAFVDRRDGEDVEHVGEYLEIARPRRLVFTLRVPKYSGNTDRISIEIVPVEGSGCVLTLTHEGVSEELAARVQEGWAKMLDGLGAEVDLTSLRIRRHFDFPPARVFDAWTDPRIAAKWLFTTPTSEGHETRMDLRVGGRWTILDRRAGVDYKALGEYLEIERPRRLVFSFSMPQFSAETAQVIVEIESAGTGCDLTLTHKRLPWASVPETDKGWTAMLNRLPSALS